MNVTDSSRGEKVGSTDDAFVRAVEFLSASMRELDQVIEIASMIRNGRDVERINIGDNVGARKPLRCAPALGTESIERKSVEESRCSSVSISLCAMLLKINRFFRIC